MAMRICITNDDGIHAEGLLRLVEWAQKLGEVVVYAPKVEQSGKSHGIELHHAIEVKETVVPGAARAFMVDSTPADCVRFALLGAFEQFDLIISGINRGCNIGQDIIYSGTVGAAFEAAALGCPRTMAVSTEPESLDTAIAHLDQVWDYIQKHALFEKCRIWNVNIPGEVKGDIAITRQGGPYYSDDFAAEGDDMFMPVGKILYKPSQHLLFDTDAVLTRRCISLTPLTIDRTDWSVYRACCSEAE